MTIKCPLIRTNMAKEEVASCVVDNDNGEAGFPGDDAVDSGMCKASSAGDDAPCAVPSSVSVVTMLPARAWPRASSTART